MKHLALLTALTLAGCGPSAAERQRMAMEDAKADAVFAQALAQMHEPWPVATAEDIAAADACQRKYGGGPPNPLFMQKYGVCPQKARWLNPGMKAGGNS